MDINRTSLSTIFAVCLSVFILAACSDTEPASLFDETVTFPEPPAISSLTPADSFFAGYLNITIDGSNFSDDITKNAVYFNNVKAQILSATPNQIVVKTPNYVADSIYVQVRVVGADKYSNGVQYKLEALFEDVATPGPNQTLWASAIDNNGDVYVSVSVGTAGEGITKFEPDGTATSRYGAPQAWFYRGMKAASDGSLYMIRGGAVPLIYRLPPGGGAVASWRSGVGRTEDFDFDANGFVWSAGTNEGSATNAKLNRTAPDLTLTRFDFDAQVYALRVFNNFIYIGGTRADVPTIWRVPILGDNTPGAEETVLNLTGVLDVDVRPNAITFGADGTMFVALAHTTTLTSVLPILKVAPDNSTEVFYDGILPGNILKFNWIPGTTSVLTTVIPETGTNNRTIRLNLQTNGAPEYGLLN